MVATFGRHSGRSASSAPTDPSGSLVSRPDERPRARDARDGPSGCSALAWLREARALTQSTVGELLDMDQSEVSRLEHRSDMLLSTLKRFVAATGGEMHIVVQYPDGGPVELLVDEG